MTEQLGQPGQSGAHTAARDELHPPDSPAASEDRSLGSIVSDMTTNISTLVRQEMELARTELKQEMARAGKGAGMLGGAGLAGYLTLLFLSLFVMFVLADWWDDYKWAALAVTVLWGIAAAVLAMIGKKKLQEARPELPVTQQSLKEDVQWAKAQKS
jgi:uncharacterized membrane protein YqjE